MKKTLQYLGKYWYMVLACMLFIFFQVQAQLLLPQYMSNIVTNGLQYKGIQEDAPLKLSLQTEQHMEYFLDVSSIQEAYQIDGDQYRQVAKPSKQVQGTFLLVKALEQPAILEKFHVTNSEQLYALLDQQPQMKQQVIEILNQQTSSIMDTNHEAMMKVMILNEYESLGMDIHALQMNYIFKQGALMLGIALAATLFAIASAFFASLTATKVAMHLRHDVFTHVQHFSSSEFQSFSTASLITRTTNDIQQVQQFLTMLLRLMLFAPFMGISALFKVIQYRSLMTIIFWAIAFILFVLMVTFIFTLPKFKQAQTLVDHLNRVTRGQLEGMFVIRAFNQQANEEAKFDTVNQKMTKVNIFINRAMATVMPIMTFMMSAISIVIIWNSSHLIDQGSMQIGDMMAFLQYSVEILLSFMFIAMLFIMVPRFAVSGNRIQEVLDKPLSIHDPDQPIALPKQAAPIIFDHVSFAYPGADQNVLEDIHFTVQPGQTVAIIGSTGCGKSTLVQLLPRFFDITKGHIYIGNVDIQQVTQNQLRQQIGFVPQKGVLFSGDIKSNITYGNPNLSQQQIEEILAISQSKEFVDQMELGIHTPITQGGTNVSGGQKQRLSIARALAKEANIYIFDDTFSALDYQTDALLRQALQTMIKKTKATVFIVAQRISTILNADLILVLDNGKIVGQGTHHQLLQTCQVYQEIAQSQLSKEELSHESK